MTSPASLSFKLCALGSIALCAERHLDWRGTYTTSYHALAQLSQSRCSVVLRSVLT